MKSMKRAIIMLTLTVCWANARSQERGNLDAASIDNFEARVAEYVKLHNTAKEKLARLTPTDAPSAIKRHEHELTREIRGMRRQARQGDISVPASLHRVEVTLDSSTSAFACSGTLPT